MASQNYKATDEEVTLVMDKLDRDRDGKIDFEEFIDEIKPRDYLR